MDHHQNGYHVCHLRVDHDSSGHHRRFDHRHRLGVFPDCLGGCHYCHRRHLDQDYLDDCHHYYHRHLDLYLGCYAGRRLSDLCQDLCCHLFGRRLVDCGQGLVCHHSGYRLVADLNRLGRHCHFDDLSLDFRHRFVPRQNLSDCHQGYFDCRYLENDLDLCRNHY